MRASIPILLFVASPPSYPPVDVHVAVATRTRGTLSVTTTRGSRQVRRSTGSLALAVRHRPDAPINAPVTVRSVVVIMMSINDATTTRDWVTAVATGQARGVASTAPAGRVGRVVMRVTAGTGIPVDITHSAPGEM